MYRVSLFVLRICVGFWVGAAVLFVLTSVAEQRYPGFDDATRNTLAAIRFPIYYATGFTCLSVAAIAGVTLLISSDRNRMSFRLSVGLVFAALLLMGIDWLFVFSPLQEMMTSEIVVRDDRFARLHTASMILNAIGLFLVIIATGAITRRVR